MQFSWQSFNCLTILIAQRAYQLIGTILNRTILNQDSWYSRKRSNDYSPFESHALPLMKRRKLPVSSWTSKSLDESNRRFWFHVAFHVVSDYLDSGIQNVVSTHPLTHPLARNIYGLGFWISKISTCFLARNRVHRCFGRVDGLRV